jgi:NAD(P)-dependent dehydrogenase (short-subunit alcohol dehydrogenase family)
MSLSRSLKGSIALVTGAGSGMGRATAEIFGAEGAHVAVTDFNAGTAEATAEAIRKAGGSAQAWALDVSDADQVRTVVAAVADRFGGLECTPLGAADQPAYRESCQRLRQPTGLFDALRRQVRIGALPGLGAQRQRVPDQQEQHGRSLTSRR